MNHQAAHNQPANIAALWRGVQRYGFNGQEFETELDASNSTFSAEFWMYSSGIVSRWDLDPKRKSDASAYQILLSSPILYIDPKGDTTIVNLFHSKEPAKFHFAAKRYLENDKDQPRDNVFVVCAHGNSGLVIFPDEKREGSAVGFIEKLSGLVPEFKDAVEAQEPVTLIFESCNVGSFEYYDETRNRTIRTDEPIGLRLSEELPENSTVIAPNGYCMYGFNGEHCDVVGIKQTTYNEQINTGNGGYNHFKGGKLTGFTQSTFIQNGRPPLMKPKIHY
jgi:hypothetical protein